MKTSVKLNVSAHYFFQRILDIRLYDIYEATGRSVSVKQLAGFAYETENNSGEPCRISVTSLKPNQSYHYQIETQAMVISAAYELKALAKDQVQVDFRQISKTKKQLHSMKDRLTSKIFDHIKANNFKKVLKQMEIGY
ncbi:hypothetical protein LFYK43_22610 [Ligilactobacillus salitolerans]|uniref:DUF3284 domain-containing protein n=1 Tax=Ligilactobacillus salitolerans TaxID=1808352 RepID=A0A401IWA4_9LACO|nr:DUF3284 domain-containing protein [Ligilactobacillus salitolerans]GBG95802.1 hypothetical protein LFYK43_22610 [Ligilactobacillus salitolerans]